jgi:DNA-binding CsgD family transcriptional regulator
VHAHEALGIARDGEIALYEVWSLASLVELELVAGELTAARSHVDELVAVITRHDLRDVDLFPGPELVEIHLRLDRPGEAAAAAEAFSRAAEAKGQPWARARAARARALLGDHAAFEEALDLHGQTADVFETARTRLAYGARLRRDGRRVRAREHLRAAHGVFERLGAAPWADRARSELAATGEIAHRHRPAGLEELTSQELQVALLLGDGKTTREAAAALFLSPKTVEYHLGNLYRRLGIHSRDELRAILDGAHGHD